MVKKFGKRLLPLMLAILLIMTAMPLSVSAKSIDLLDGQISVSDSLNNISSENNVVTIKAPGGAGLFISPKTNNINIYNNTENKAKLTFNYSASNYGSFSLGNESGTYEVTLEAGKSCEFSITGKNAILNNTAVLTLSNFSFVAAADSSDVTFDFDSSCGSVTVGGTAVADGEVKNIPLSGAELVATKANDKVRFLGWVNSVDGSLLSTQETYTVKPAQAMTIKAVFVSANNTTPYFMIGSSVKQTFKYGFLNGSTGTYWTIPNGTHLFDNLTDAINASKASDSAKCIVLMTDGILPASTYTIPSGCTLLIPFDNSNTLYKDVTQGRVHNSSTETTSHPMSIYRTLTMADGANIVVNGEMSLSAKHLYAQGNRTGGGSPVDNVSAVKMEGNSNITVNSGGKLYTYGYIYGSGSVLAHSGATVYENFQVMDFRGGTQSTEMKNGVFPFSQYYVQNIEVPLTLEYGSQECSFTTIYMSDMIMSSKVDFIGKSNCMFNLKSGSVTKRYDGSTDRLIIDLNGNLDVSPISMDMGMSSINSKDYDLPINGNITITAKDGSNISMNQDLAMLPGSEIILEEGAKCTVGSGINIFIYDADKWDKFTGAGTDTTFKPVTHTMSRTYTRTDADLVDAKIQVDGTIDASKGYVYTTAGGANVYSTKTGSAAVNAGTQTVTHQLIFTNTQYIEIPITPVKFKNGDADGSYLESTSGTYNYNNEHGKWVNGEHIVTPGEHVAPNCENKGYTPNDCTCGYHYDDEIEDALGHEWVEKDTPATCVKEGETYKECTKCGEKHTLSIIPIVDHTLTDEETVAPTCTENGLLVIKCKNCGYKEKEEVIPATGHDYGEWTERTAPGCESEGVEYRVCGCGNEETRPIAVKGHSYTSVVTAPTCTEAGFTTYTCSACNHTYTGNPVDANGHSMSDWITDSNPTCVDSGLRHKECSNCDYREEEAISALGHSYTSVVTAPTCTEQGFTTHTCANCSDSYVDSYVDATGHTYGEWEVINEPTHIAEGLKQHTCHCGHTESEAIAKIICDYNGDGFTNTIELAMMRKFILETEVPNEEQLIMFDFNYDGNITLKDLVRLKKLIAGIPF